MKVEWYPVENMPLYALAFLLVLHHEFSPTKHMVFGHISLWTVVPRAD